jgi:hypothetical protein
MAAFDPFSSYDFGPIAPAIGAYAITPADADLPVTVRRIRVGTAGAVSVTDRRGVTTVIPNVQVGEAIDMVVHRVNATGTTASGITGFI